MDIETSIQVLLAFVLVIIVAMVFGLLMAFPIVWIWNTTMVALFGVPTIAWGQAWSLLVLCRLLIPTSSNSSK